ncbi:RNA 2',3'-cyclic phosphodiesterase [Zhaonella formicivorans]|uniref:RNA 2',3'-cyclic phosphodiesterase n=1 Tax=Zhaonella formicivorans TaxID=2528593 RepID=UPI001D0FFE8F|nr:RNA 2',3'-cyclic phosphodiesterase [Zhaonella formicivorans]
MRLFLAIHLTPELKNVLAEQQAELKRKITGVKWVEPENIHLTIKFLGEIAKENLPYLITKFKGAAGKFKPFDLKVKGMGAFPTLARARIIWAGIAQPWPVSLLALQAGLEQVLLEKQFCTLDKNFYPHLTLGRVKKSSGGLNCSGFLSSTADKVFGTSRVDAFYLMQSVLHQTGPCYTVVQRFPLNLENN